MRSLRIFVALALVVAGVASTVGSGNGAGASNNIGNTNFGGCCIDFPPPVLAITINNAQDVSATIVQAITQLLDVANIIGGKTFPSPPAAPDLLSSHSKFELITTVAATGGDVTEPCAVSGTVRARGIPDNDPVSLSVGDQFDLVFDICDDGDGYTLDGRLAQVLVRELKGDPRTDVFRIRYEVLALFPLRVTAGAYSYFTSSSRSGFTLEWDSLAFPVVVLTAIPSGQLILNSYADNYYNGYSWPFEQAGEHTLTINADISIPTTLVDARASVMSNDALGGAVSYEVIVPLQAPDGQDPESGEILISASAGQGSVRIVIESSASVRLEIDSDDDGIVDDTQYITWSELQSWKSI